VMPYFSLRAERGAWANEQRRPSTQPRSYWPNEKPLIPIPSRHLNRPMINCHARSISNDAYPSLINLIGYQRSHRNRRRVPIILATRLSRTHLKGALFLRSRKAAKSSGESDGTLDTIPVPCSKVQRPAFEHGRPEHARGPPMDSHHGGPQAQLRHTRKTQMLVIWLAKAP
jgi:hypothetical protein